MTSDAAKYDDEVKRTEVKPTLIDVSIKTQHDVLLLVEACLQGVLHHIPGHPQPAELQCLFQSGNIFVYEENSSGITKWKDGLVWREEYLKDGLRIAFTKDKALVKRSGTVEHNKTRHYVISYCVVENSLEKQLKSPSEDLRFSRLSIRNDLLFSA